jgi:hypothetical protein
MDNCGKSLPKDSVLLGIQMNSIEWTDGGDRTRIEKGAL